MTTSAQAAADLGCLQHADELALWSDRPDPADAGHPDIAELIALHAVEGSLVRTAASLVLVHQAAAGK